VLNEPLTKLSIDPAALPLKTATVKHGTQWYDHKLVGVSVFHLSASWTNSQAFPTHVTIPVGVPTSNTFKVTVTSVCQETAILKPTINDMKFLIELGALAET